jgi:hypothetical protein
MKGRNTFLIIIYCAPMILLGLFFLTIYRGMDRVMPKKKLINETSDQPVRTIFISTQKDTTTGPKETKIYKLKRKTINSDSH